MIYNRILLNYIIIICFIFVFPITLRAAEPCRIGVIFGMLPSLVVTSVFKDSPAMKSGIMPGDIITAIDGNKISTYAELQNIISNYRCGDKISLSISNNSNGFSERIVDVILDKIDSNEMSKSTISIPVKEGTFILSDLSISVDKTNPLTLPRLNGNILNSTDKDWLSLVFNVQLFDEKGNIIYPGLTHQTISKDYSTFTITGIKKGETKALGSDDGTGEMLLIQPSTVTKIKMFVITFNSGVYNSSYCFVMTHPTERKDNCYEDQFIKISFSLTKSEIHYVLKNKTMNPITIDWNKMSYVDINGESHKIIHSGIKYSNKSEPQAPTIIPPTANIQDIVFPIDNIYYVDGWNERQLFPEAPEALNYIGKTVSVFMPLDINGTVKYYLFSFKIQDVKM